MEKKVQILLYVENCTYMFLPTFFLIYLIQLQFKKFWKPYNQFKTLDSVLFFKFKIVFHGFDQHVETVIMVVVMPHAKITFPFWVPDATKLAKTLISVLGVGPPERNSRFILFWWKKDRGRCFKTGWVSILPVSKRKRPKISIKYRKLGNSFSYTSNEFHIISFDPKKFIFKPKLTFFLKESAQVNRFQWTPCFFSLVR